MISVYFVTSWDLKANDLIRMKPFGVEPFHEGGMAHYTYIYIYIYITNNNNNNNNNNYSLSLSLSGGMAQAVLLRISRPEVSYRRRSRVRGGVMSTAPLRSVSFDGLRSRETRELATYCGVLARR